MSVYAQNCFWRDVPLNHCIPLNHVQPIRKICTILLITGCRHQVKAKDVCTYFLCADIVHISEPRREKGRSTGTDGWNNGWKKESQMEVRWLLTNRKHGGKT